MNEGQIKLLITGGCGYVGTHVVNECLKKNYKVTVIDKQYFGCYLFNHKNLKVIKNDLRKMNLKKYIKQNDIVIHLASLVGAHACEINPDITMDINYNITKKIVDYCKLFNKKLIFASTCSVYGNQTDILTELNQPLPVDFYAFTKLFCEKYINEKLPNTTILRFGTIYGYSPRMRFDLVVNLFIGKGSNHEKITVFGGKQERPFVYILDVVNAIVFTIENPKEKGIYNIVSEKATNILSMAKEISKITNTEIITISNKEDYRNYIVSNKKLLLLGWKPKYTFLQGIKKTYKQIRKNNINYKDNKYYNHKILIN